jgi:hypothetical protein
MVNFVRLYVAKEGIVRVCFAGGVAANVKMNQRIKEIPIAEEDYIHLDISKIYSSSISRSIRVTIYLPLKRVINIISSLKLCE